jgi:hypothetical protein
MLNPPFSLWRSPQRSQDVLHQQHQVQRVGGGWLEFRDEVQVERPGRRALGMDEQPAATNFRADLCRAAEHIRQQSRAEAPAFVVKVYPEPGQQGNRLGIAAGTLPQAQRGLRWRDAGHAPGVVSHHIAVARFGDHEHPAAAATGMGLAGVLFQPDRLLLRPAFESVKTIGGGQQPGRQVTRAHS